jgi:hypothetical protein
MKEFRFGKYGYLYFTAAFFALSFAGHAFFSWFGYLQDQAEHGAPPSVSEYLVLFFRDTLENWQSEFLQLIWQVAGLTFLLHVGSPQSKEGDERKEEKLDAILRAVDKKDADRLIATIDKRWQR